MINNIISNFVITHCIYLLLINAALNADVDHKIK